jgi:hypothetical protein
MPLRKQIRALASRISRLQAKRNGTISSTATAVPSTLPICMLALAQHNNYTSEANLDDTKPKVHVHGATRSSSSSSSSSLPVASSASSSGRTSWAELVASNAEEDHAPINTVSTTVPTPALQVPPPRAAVQAAVPAVPYWWSDAEKDANDSEMDVFVSPKRFDRMKHHLSAKSGQHFKERARIESQKNKRWAQQQRTGWKQ